MFGRRVFMRHCLWKAVCHLLISTEVPRIHDDVCNNDVYVVLSTGNRPLCILAVLHNKLVVYLLFLLCSLSDGGRRLPFSSLPTVISKARYTYRPKARTLFVLVFTISTFTCSGTLIALFHAPVSVPSRRPSPIRSMSFSDSPSSLLLCGRPPDLYTFGFGAVTGTAIPINFSSFNKIDRFARPSDNVCSSPFRLPEEFKTRLVTRRFRIHAFNAHNHTVWVETRVRL